MLYICFDTDTYAEINIPSSTSHLVRGLEFHLLVISHNFPYTD